MMRRNSAIKVLGGVAAICAISTQSLAQPIDREASTQSDVHWYTKDEILRFEVGGVRLKMSPEESLGALQAHGYYVGSRDVYLHGVKKTLSAQDLLRVAASSTNELYVGGNGDVDIATCGFEDAVIIGVWARQGRKDKSGNPYEFWAEQPHGMIGSSFDECSHGYVSKITARSSDGSDIVVSFVSTPKGAVVLSAEYQLSSQISYNLFVKAAIEKYGNPSLIVKNEGSGEVESLSWMTIGDKDGEESGVHVYKSPNLATYLRGDDSRWLELSMGDEDGWRTTIDEAVEQEVDRRMPQVAPRL